MFLDYFIKVFQDNKKNDAIIWKGKTYTYDWLLTKYIYWQDVLQSDDIKSYCDDIILSYCFSNLNL